LTAATGLAWRLISGVRMAPPLHAVDDRAVARLARDLDRLREGGDRFRIGRVDAVLQALPGHDAVERAGIDMQKTEVPADAFGHRRFTRAGGAVNRDDSTHMGFLPWWPDITTQNGAVQGQEGCRGQGLRG
jgi:hypothetical protein